MIRGALKRIFVTEIYARLALIAISLMVALFRAGYPRGACATVIGLVLMPIIYRLKFKRW